MLVLVSVWSFEKLVKSLYSIIAAAALTILPEALRGFADYRMLIYAVILIIVMLTTNNKAVGDLLQKLLPGKKEEEESHG